MLLEDTNPSFTYSIRTVLNMHTHENRNVMAALNGVENAAVVNVGVRCPSLPMKQYQHTRDDGRFVVYSGKPFTLLLSCVLFHVPWFPGR